MAVLTDVRCLHVSRILAGRVRTVMAAHTVPGDVDVIEIRRQPADGAVAVIAVIAAGNMVLAFAGGDVAVVAGPATTEDLGMVDDHDRRKHVRVMAVFAHIRRLHVCRILTRRLRAVVTVDAVRGDGRMVERRRQPACGAMTVVAGVTTGNMCGQFADGDDTVMAGAAGAEHLGVVDGHHRGEHVGRVAILTDIGRINMRLVLSGRVSAVVAAHAVARDIDMVEIRWQPAGGAMTVVASVATGYVRGILASGDSAIVTGAANADDLRVIDPHHGRKKIGRVAVFANIRCLNVCLVLAGRVGAVMAAHTVTRDIDVVEIRRQPGNRAVTVVAIVAAGDVSRVLAGGSNAVMATAAIAENLGVIHGYHRRKHCRRMTVFTNIGCLNVCLVLTD